MVISKHLEMEDGGQKSLALSSVELVAKEASLRAKALFRGKQAKKGPRAPRNSQLRNGITKKHKAKGNGEKNIIPVKCYSYGKKEYFARDCPEPAEVPSSNKTPKIYVYSHASIANPLPQWIVDTQATKHIL